MAVHSPGGYSDSVQGLATLARRFVVICAIGLWLGGTTLYTGFVIPIGHRHVPAAQFGLVTQEVTRTLNAVGGIAVVVLFWNIWSDRASGGRLLQWGAWGTWILLLASLVALFILHSKLDILLVHPKLNSTEVELSADFDFWHDGYKLATAVQWGAGLLHLGCVLVAWRLSDRATPDRNV